jgi:hypothetical protein
MCYFLDSNGELERSPVDLDVDSYRESTQSCFGLASNGKDRFVVLWVCYSPDSAAFQVYDRNGGIVGEPYTVVTSTSFKEVAIWNLAWAGYFPSTAMAPDGRFVVSWTEMDPLGNFNLRAQLFSRNGVPISAPFQVNEPDQFEYSFQISANRGVSCTNDRILFTWLDNGMHRGWDVMAKVTDWNPTGISEPSSPSSPVTPPPTNLEISSSVGQTITLHYSNYPRGFSAAVYDASGRKVDYIKSTLQSGTITWGSHQSPGVYFMVPQEAQAKAIRFVLIK